jgi:demethylmenaquinone methyltransferase/2-methoxy-6-polyprenyl-1,4-benzoquinol methylase
MTKAPGAASAIPTAGRAEAVRRMFGAIAPTYDLLNRILSFGVDESWRRRLAARLPSSELRVLDLACGTGDVAFAIAAARRPSTLFGADFALPMLKAARSKAARRGAGPLLLQNASAEDLPYRSDSFDAVTIAFGIRNVIRRERALGEIVRVLKPGGISLVLDFSLPPNPLIRALYGFYFHRLLPLVGGLISGNFSAYRYLPRSVEAFPPRQEFARMMEEQGLRRVAYEDLTLGIATLYEGHKAGA